MPADPHTPITNLSTAPVSHERLRAAPTTGSVEQVASPRGAVESLAPAFQPESAMR